MRSGFRSEYLGQLRLQSLRNYKDKPLSVGEIVLVEDVNKKWSFWNLARILKVIPGCDGQVRLAIIKTNFSELLRPVQRLFRLEIENSVSEKKDESAPIFTSSGKTVKPVKK